MSFVGLVILNQVLVIFQSMKYRSSNLWSTQLWFKYQNSLNRFFEQQMSESNMIHSIEKKIYCDGYILNTRCKFSSDCTIQKNAHH